MLNSTAPAGPVFRRIAILILIALHTAEAPAQTSGSISLVSDYRFRGRSLSDGNPAPQIGISYDSPSGWYAGGFASKVTSYWDKNDAQLLAYGGYAGSLASELQWEAGAIRSTFAQSEGYDYAEFYVGLSTRNINSRLYYSPASFGRSSSTFYLELNGAYPFNDRFSLVGHAGGLRTTSPEYGAAPFQSDTRIGISAKFQEWILQMERVESNGGQSYTAYRAGQSSPRIVFSASYTF